MSATAHETLILSGSDISTLVGSTGLNVFMDALITSLEESIKEFDPSVTQIPVRSGFNYTEPASGLIEWMPLYKSGSEVVLKLVGYHPENPENYGLPTIISTVYAYDTRTGHLKAVVDGVLLTALRTGAASAVASKYLAKQDSEVLGLIGCGAQAITQLHAISRVFDIKQVLYYDTDESAMASFESRLSIIDLDIELNQSSITEIVGASDILCTATSIAVDEGPLFNDLKTMDHLHINAVGSDFPGKVELPVELLRRGMVCPDFTEQAMHEGECQQLYIHEIGSSLDAVLKSEDQYLDARSELTVFDSTGWALEDQVAMDLILDFAQQHSAGTRISIEALSGDARNPYSSIPSVVSSLDGLQLEQLIKPKPTEQVT